MKTNTYHKLDKIFLHKFFSIPLFLMVMYLMFVFAINIGGALQEFFDLSSRALFIEGALYISQSLSLPPIIQIILAEGVGLGINVALTFIPVLFCMFLFLAFLEASGYMARAALVMDKFMRLLGLPGEAFVPMIVGFGCNVPAVLGTKELKNRDDRILAILMTPFMSCSARLAIYAVFVAAFFSSSGQNIIFALYLIGIIVAILTGLLLRKTILKPNPNPVINSLPEYRIPAFRPLVIKASRRLKRFLKKAFQLIVPFCIALSLLGQLKSNDSDYLVIDKLGRAFTPIFKPMGIEEDNWPAVVSLFSGMVAKEVMVGSLSSMYTHEANIDAANSGGELYSKIKGESILATLEEALYSIPKNLSQVKASLLSPISSSAPEVDVHNSVLGAIYTKFGSPQAAFSYLLFVLLYFPCISVVVAISKELNRYWAAFSIVWSTGVAYFTATMFYQISTFASHPLISSFWVVVVAISSVASYICLKEIAKKRNKVNALSRKAILATTRILTN